MAKLYNLARMTTATTGTGTITLGAAASGYLTFAQAGIANGDVIDYAIKDGNNSEIGTGTYTASGTTLTRTVTKSTNSNAAINLSGTAEVFITPRAETLADASQLTTGTLPDARLSSNVPLLNSANSFTANLTVAGADLKSYRAGGTTGVVYLDSAGSKYLYNNGSRYALPAQGLDVGGDVGATNTAKAWVNFNGTGTVAIRGSFNVSSITDNGVGNYTVNLSTAMASANYAIAMSGNNGSNGTNVTAPNMYGPGQTASSFTLQQTGTGGGAGGNTDSQYMEAVIFGA